MKEPTAVLDELGNKYLDELYALFPIQRIVFFMMAIPLVLGALDASSTALWQSLISTTPLETYNFPDGAMWRQPWLACLLCLLCYMASLLCATVISKLIGELLARSSRQASFTKSIRNSANEILARLDDTKPIVAALLARLEVRKKALAIRVRLAEITTSTSVLWVVLGSKWDMVDFCIWLVLTTAMIFAQVTCFRFYISNVAPTWLLLGFLTNSFTQFVDGLTPD